MKRDKLIRAGATAECHASPPCENCRQIAEGIIDAVLPLIAEGIAELFDDEAATYEARSSEAGLLTVEGAGYAHDQYRLEAMARLVRGWEPE